MALITMSKKELGRLEALVDLDAGRITAARAARLIGVSERQVFRLLRSYRASGAAGLVSRRRGRPSNRRHPDEVREAALAAIRERYADFGPTLAALSRRNGRASAPPATRSRRERSGATNLRHLPGHGTAVSPM